MADGLLFSEHSLGKWSFRDVLEGRFRSPGGVGRERNPTIGWGRAIVNLPVGGTGVYDRFVHLR